jgi:hypothetical protein
LDLWEQLGEDRQLGRVGAHIAHRLDEPVALIGGEVVLSHGVRKLVALDAADRGGDDLTRVGGAVTLDVRCDNPVVEDPTELERIGRTPAPDDDASQAAWVVGSCEQQGAGADVRADRVWVLEPELVGEPDDELPHGARRQERVATLGMPEAGEVGGHEMRVLGEAVPHLVEGVKALRPGAQQERVIVPLLALGEADLKPVDRPELRLDRCVQRGAHGSSF